MKKLKPSKEWRDILNKKGYTRNYPFKNKDLEKIKQKLLKLGGWAVILPKEELDNDEYLERGKIFDGKSTLKLGEQSQCHANTARLWHESKEKIKICTGYALSGDGVWRVHTWGIQKTGTKIKIIETTEKRIKYFGYVLSRIESSFFLHINMESRPDSELIDTVSLHTDPT